MMNVRYPLCLSSKNVVQSVSKIELRAAALPSEETALLVPDQQHHWTIELPDSRYEGRGL